MVIISTFVVDELYSVTTDKTKKKTVKSRTKK